MIIENVSMGPNYRKVTLRKPGHGAMGFKPGACAKVNGRWLALADATEEDLTFIVKSDSFLLTEPITSVEAPLGNGFSCVESKGLVTCLVGGTGLAAVLSLVRERSAARRPVALRLLCRGAEYPDVVAAFPFLRGVDFGCWDTSFLGRPPLERVVDPATSHVAFAGPKELLEGFRSMSPQVPVDLNY